jgi:hypothetical protein
LQVRTAGRLVGRGGGSLRERLGPLDERLVFVVGSPRSGTTFLGAAIGSLPGFVDLGEVTPLKAAIPDLSELPPEEAAPRIRRLLAVSRRLGLVGSLRAVEQTPETAFVLRAVRLAFPRAQIVHLVRDGRDVVCSLLERGWLSAGRRGEDDARRPYGAEARFWVEAERAAEFARASDARRAAWAWRRYVTAARESQAGAFELRYERMVREPVPAARELARFLGAPDAELGRALGAAHGESVGRFARDLAPDQLADVMTESGSLLDELGYLRAV